MNLKPIDRDALYAFAQDTGSDILFTAYATVELPSGEILPGNVVNAILDVAGPHPAGTDRKIRFRVRGPYVLPHIGD